ncbi:MAG: hypothetical protein AAB410_04330 [Patescibacteria group bacterium]
MAYITKQKFNIRELVGSLPPTKTILLVINEENLREIYRRQLIEHNFQVNTAVFADVVAMARYLNSADLLIVELANTSDEKLEFLRIITKDFSNLPVITVGHTISGNILEKVMSLGVVSHLDRKFSRPADLALMVKTLFFE